MRQTLLSPFGRWGDRFREIEYSSKATWSREWQSHYLDEGLSDFWAVPRSLVPEASLQIMLPPPVSRTHFKEQWYTWNVFWVPKIYEAISWFFTDNMTLFILCHSEMNWFFFFFFFFLVFLSFLGLHPEAYGGSQARGLIGTIAYTTATAMRDLSCICDLCHSLGQRRILNPLSETWDWTRNLMVPSQIR